MTAYADSKETADDRERILAALDELDALRSKYRDVLAIPEVVTLHDITEYRLDTPRGPTAFKTVYDRKTAVKILESFAGVDYIQPEEFESTIVCALQDYLKTKEQRG
jgi:hypothetical protein